ncbi:N-acetylglucosamine-6-phosphate deacetylase [Paenibacillus solisilvae]|uniref:N-acetylglucosamine-6-phosphate deacetylase n=1 Tax=Paenibacillus solisilvae TaxID=2486751 RepID=A0ABW0VYZ1_9BACL
MATVALTGGLILLPDGNFEKGSVLFNGDKISGVSTGDLPGDVELIDVTGCTVAPGFIDTHAHGALGRNFMEGSREAYKTISGHKTSGGVTSCLATTTSASLENTLFALQYASSVYRSNEIGEMELLGVHLEGPFVNPAYRGAHMEEFVRQANISELEAIWEAAGSALRVVTLAPEVPLGLEAVRFLSERGVNVSIGHSGASYEETKQAISRGVSRATHLFSAMIPIHHRNPGAIPALFEAANVFLEMIVDGHHMHPSIVGMAVRQVESHRPVMITDSADVTGLPDGAHRRWEGLEVVIDKGTCRTLSGGLAGSIMRMDQGVKNLVELVGLPLSLALRMASENPARSIGVFERKGSLEAGKDADIVVLNPDLTVLMTIARGHIIYDARV